MFVHFNPGLYDRFNALFQVNHFLQKKNQMFCKNVPDILLVLYFFLEI